MKFLTNLSIILISLTLSLMADDTTIEILQKNLTVKDSKTIVFCWSKADHGKGTHDYKGFAEKMSKTFEKVENINAEAVKGFPDQETWAKADLVVFFLTMKSLSETQIQTLDNHLAEGKSILVLHQGLVLRQNYKEWADRIGYAFSWEKGPTRSKWGKFNNPIKLDTKHEIFETFDSSVTFNDELYWNLQKGSKGTINVLGKTKAPKDENNEWPAFWTVQHKNSNAKEGRVFCAVPGHFNSIVNSRTFETILFRGMSWCLKSK